MYAQSFVIHSSVDVHLVLLYVLSMLNRAEINKKYAINSTGGMDYSIDAKVKH